MPTTLTPNLDLFRSNKEITPLDEYNFNEFYWFPKKECMVIVALAILEQVLQENDEDQKPLFFWYGAITKRPLHMQNAPEELRPIILPKQFQEFVRQLKMLMNTEIWNRITRKYLFQDVFLKIK